MKVKIIKSSDPRYWYSTKLNEVYQVRRIDTDCVWVRPETDQYAGWNFIKNEDYVEVKDEGTNESKN
jgi:hypothetical protein